MSKKIIPIQITSEMIEDQEESGMAGMFFYDEDRNIIMDGDGLPVFDMYRIITPTELFMFKAHKEDVILIGKQGQLVELFYPTEDDEEEDYEQ